MNLFNPNFAFVLGLIIALSSCKHDHEHHKDNANSQEDPASEVTIPTNSIDIPLTVQNNLGITFAKVERRIVEKNIRIPGAFELEPLAKKEYRMALSGDLEFLVKQYDVVNEGTPLFRVRSLKYLELKQAVAIAQASFTQINSRLTTARIRQNKLAEANIKRADLNEQIANLEAELLTAKIKVTSAERYLRKIEEMLSGKQKINSANSGDWIQIVSKRKGVVENLALSDGGYAQEGDLILSIVDPTMIRFRAVSMQSDTLHWQNGQTVKITPPQSDKLNINHSIPSKLQIGVIANPTTRTMDILAVPDKEITAKYTWARPGVTGFLEITQNSTEYIVLAIPTSAVVKDGITHVFFKRDPQDPDKAIRVEADMGISDGRWVEIMSELGPNDEVVLNGAYELKLASSQSGLSQKGGHFHADGTFHADDH